jgi:hypothetical protein
MPPAVGICDSAGQTRHKASELVVPVMRVVMRVLLHFVSRRSYLFSLFMNSYYLHLVDYMVPYFRAHVYIVYLPNTNSIFSLLPFPPRFARLTPATDCRPYFEVCPRLWPNTPATSISTAKRLSEFLGVKTKALHVNSSSRRSPPQLPNVLFPSPFSEEKVLSMSFCLERSLGRLHRH